jgi:hypothetical protein
LLNLMGESKERTKEARRILGLLGLADHGGQRYYHWLCQNGVFDHGQMWGRGCVPLLIVGHPYRIIDQERTLLSQLGRFPGLTIGVNDRPSYYGFGTNHVRIGLAEDRWPKSSAKSSAKSSGR